MTIVDKYKDWRCFKDQIPKPNCGILIRIFDEKGNYRGHTDIENHLFYGFLWDCGYVYIVYDINSNSGMSWKATKDFDYKHFWWFYRSECEDPENNISRHKRSA